MKNLKKLENYIKTKENQYYERKSAKIKPLEILRQLVGFANAEGGELVIGIEDNGNITGFKCSGAHKIEEFKNLNITALKETPIMAEHEEIDVINIKGEEDKILVIRVKFEKDKVIKSYDGKVYLRQHNKTIELNSTQVLELQYDRGQRYFEDETLEHSSLEDLDYELLQEYKNKMGVPNIDTKQLLESRNLMIDGKLTNACILLFGNNPTKFLPQAGLRFVKYDGLSAGVGFNINIIKDVKFDKAIPRIIREVKIFISSQLKEFQYLDSDGVFKMMPEYPEFAWFEGIVNALIHRNYSIRGEYIRVIQYDDRLEISSPGLLPNIVTLKNIFEKRYSRNPRISRFLTEFGWVREMNEGVKRIYSEMENLFLKNPVYSEPSNNVLLVLENNILNRQIRINDKLKKLIGSEVFKNLTVDEKKIIYTMYNTGMNMTKKEAMNLTKKSSTYCNKVLKILVEKNMLVWFGSSKTDNTQYYRLNF